MTMTENMNNNSTTHDYAAAFEMAATGRYREARAMLLAILEMHPAHTSALVLLGKVEYYLKQFDDSRKRFETALMYEPGNFAAFHGLEYYKEHSRKSLFYMALAVVVVLFFVISGMLYVSLRASFVERITVLEQTAARQSQRLEALNHTVSEKAETMSRQLEPNREAIEAAVSFLKDIRKNIQGLKDEISLLKREQRKIPQMIKRTAE